MRLLVAVVAAAPSLAACLSIPPFRGYELVSYSDVEEHGGATVTSSESDFTLHFASGGNFHLPDRLTIGGSDNLLGHDDKALCYAESGTGFLLYPTPRISADIATQPEQNQLVPIMPMRGPAVVQVRLDWATGLVCSQTRAPGGHSIFTVFPDGRIVRHDTLEDPSKDQIFSNDCKCQSYVDPTNTPDEFIIESYWTFARSFGSLSTISVPDGTAGQPEDLPSPVGGAQVSDAICLDAGGYQVASFQPPSGDLQKPQNTIFPTNNLIVHRDQQRLGPSELQDLSWDTYSVLFVERSGCTTAAQHVRDYYMPPTLMVNQTPVTASPFDGIYDGDMNNGKPPGFEAPDGTITLSLPPTLPDGTPPPPFTGSFAVWLRFPTAITVPVAKRAGANNVTDIWYVPQQVDDRSWIIWFKEPLKPGDDTILIDQN